MINQRRTASVLATSLALGALVLAASPVTAGGAGGVEREGNCSTSADWRLEVEREDGGLQVDLRIRQDDQPGRVYDIRIRQNGNKFFDQDRITDEDGEIRLRRQRPNTAGSDTFFFKALGPGTIVCRGSVTI